MRRVRNIGVAWRCFATALLLLIVLIALAVLAPSRVRIRAITAPLSQRAREDCEFASFFPGVGESEIEVTQIADLDGSLWERTGVRLDLILVRFGVTEGDGASELIGTSGARLDHPFFRYSMRPHVVLAMANTNYGRFAALGSYGGPRSGSRGPTSAPREPGKVKKGYDRTIMWSRREIVYVEGADEPIVSPGMSLEEFRDKNNTGEYLVVVASLN